jgi:hypothetical protein
MQVNSYREVDKTMPLGRANLYGSLLFIPACSIFVIPHILIHGDFSYRGAESLAELGMLLAVLAISIVVHEGLHGIGYLLGGAKRNEVSFGVKQMTPYAHCKAALRVNGYRLAVALPGLILGILPGMAGIAIDNTMLTLFGGVMLGAAGGDIIILWLIRGAPRTALVLDHPSEMGCKLLLKE